MKSKVILRKVSGVSSKNSLLEAHSLQNQAVKFLPDPLKFNSLGFRMT